MADRKKLLTSAVALGTAAVMALGGTFAWQSINQRALNEASDIVNPGGRLHNDQNWVSDRENNTDIYVENFTDPDNGGETIFARVRLSEYMEIVMNHGVEGAQVVETVAGRKLDAEGNEVTDEATAQDAYQYEYAIHYFDQDNATDEFFQWAAGEESSQRPYYIPTYNLNKDSLLADLNGAYVDSVGGISNRGEEQYTYEEIGQDSSKSGYEVYDGDVNTADEVGRADLLDLIENGESAANYAAYEDNIILTSDPVDHAAAQVGETRGLISMEEWLTLTENTDRYWVYDTDGWIYWSSPIAAGETTGLLLDGFALNHVMDDTWYYAIHVESQFVTADDAGKDNGTGFYDTVNGTVPSADAETLLETIGVEIGESSSEPGTDVPGGDDPVVADHELTLSAGTGAYAVSVSDTRSNKIKLLNFGGGVPTGDIGLYTADWGTTFGSGDYTYNASTGLLTILLQDDDERLNATGTRLTVFMDGVGGDIVWADDGELTLTSNSIDGTMAPLNTGVKVYDTAGNPITELDHVTWTAGESFMVENTDYTFEDGTVTIINDEYVGRPIEIVGLGEVKAVLYVAPAASGDSTEPENYDLTVTPVKSRLAKDRDSSLNFKVLLDGQTLPDATEISLIPCGSDGNPKGQVYPTQVGSSDIYSMGANWFFNDEDTGDVKAGCKGFYTSLKQPNGDQVLSEIADLYFYEYTVTLTENGDQAAAQTMAKSDDRTTKSLHFLIDDHDKLLDSSTDTSKANFCNTVLAVSRLDTDSGIETAVTGDDLQAGLPDATGYSWYSAELDGGRLSISYAKLTGDVAASYTGSDTLIFRMTRGDKTYSAKVNFTE